MLDLNDVTFNLFRPVKIPQPRWKKNVQQVKEFAISNPCQTQSDHFKIFDSVSISSVDRTLRDLTYEMFGVYFLGFEYRMSF